MTATGRDRLYRIHRPGDGTSGSRALLRPYSHLVVSPCSYTYTAIGCGVSPSVSCTVNPHKERSPAAALEEERIHRHFHRPRIPQVKPCSLVVQMHLFDIHFFTCSRSLSPHADRPVLALRWNPLFPGFPRRARCCPTFLTLRHMLPPVRTSALTKKIFRQRGAVRCGGPSNACHWHAFRYQVVQCGSAAGTLRAVPPVTYGVCP